MTAWYENLKVGDPVIVSSHGFGGWGRTIQTVTKITKTQITAGGIRFMKSGFHREVGGTTNYSAYLSEASELEIQKVEAEVKLRQLTIKARNLRESLIVPKTIDKLERFVSALEPLVFPPLDPVTQLADEVGI